jgi:hypothetical protein
MRLDSRVGPALRARSIRSRAERGPLAVQSAPTVSYVLRASSVASCLRVESVTSVSSDA